MRSPPGLTICGVILLLGVLTACDHPQAATPLPYVTTQTCSGTFTNALDHYAIQCPRDWTVTSSPTAPHVFLFATSQHMAGMVIASPVGRITASQYVTLLQGQVNDAGTTQIALTASNTTTTIGAYVWTITATGTCTRGTTNYTMEQYATFHNGARYLVVIYAPTTSFAAMGNAFHAMLASLQLS